MIKLNYPEFWQRKGVLSLMLIPISWLYRLLGFIRRLIVVPIRLPGFVICVGNMTVGGSGKTQIVQWLAKELTAKNYKILIVTKGYGSKLSGAKLVQKTDLASDVGDESKLLAEYAQVLASKSIKAALPIIQQIQPKIIIYDDGMQNPGFIKDFTILAIDSIRAVGNNNIFPSGPLREKVSAAVDRADIITFVGNNHCSDNELMTYLAASRKPIFNADVVTISSVPARTRYYAFAGIADPIKFFKLLRDKQVNLLFTKSFPDHHNYTDEEIDSLIQEAELNQCRLITTRKDWVKINNNKDIECLDIELQFDQENKLLQMIYEKIATHI